MSVSAPGSSSRPAARPLPLAVAASLLVAAILPVAATDVRGQPPPGHLVISEIVTGGASASDELIEIYNPTAESLPLEGLEVVYASASGLTVSRRAAWSLGAPEVAPGHHVLIAHELGVYAPIADALYASGMAAAGGSVALRIQGADSAIDAVGWGTAANAWMEGSPAPAPAAGSSIERLPGGSLGSTQDTDDNRTDFVERILPDPQNSASAPTPDPHAPPTPMPTVSATPTPPPSTPAPVPSASATPAPTASPTPTPTLTITSVANARAMPNGTHVTIEGTALTASTFADGGGYVADASGGIAVLLSTGAYERGARVRVSGTIDDRFSQRTLRSSEAQLTVLGDGVDPVPMTRATGQIGEDVEGSLVRISGSIAGSATVLTAGRAYDVNDGSGATRVIVWNATGIDTGPWTSGSLVDLVGVVGQRDSSGTGTAGYRVQPRDAFDLHHVGAPTAAPLPSGGSSPGHGSGTPAPTAPGEGIVSIAEARAAPKNARLRIRGTVTMPAGIVDPTSAVIQDDTAAILLRVGDGVGPLARGERIQVDGIRSTLSGMETLRVTQPAVRLGSGQEPAAAPIRTGDAGEDLEARLVVARGAVVSNARRVSSGTVSFEIDDGSGPLRVYVAASLAADPSPVTGGAWVEVTGVLGQDTTGSQPLRGYRIWPRSADEVRVGATPSPAGEASSGVASGGSGASGAAAGADRPASLAGVGGPDLTSLRVGATLVAGPWPELGLGGLLWDGERLVAIDDESAAVVASLLAGARPPLSLELGGLRARGADPVTGVPLVALSSEPHDLEPAAAPPAPPHAGIVEDGAARWVSAVGRVEGSGDGLRFVAGGAHAALELRCAADRTVPSGAVVATGIGLASPARLLVPCDGLRPVPALDRPELVVARSVAGAAAAAGEVDLAEGELPSSAPAGAMLGLAGMLLALAAVARWRWPDGPSDAGEPATSEADGAGDDDPERRPSEVDPRPLTLVSVPHERGSG